MSHPSIVFVAGSRQISRLPAEVTSRLDTMIEKGFQILVGDVDSCSQPREPWHVTIDDRRKLGPNRPCVIAPDSNLLQVRATDADMNRKFTHGSLPRPR